MTEHQASFSSSKPFLFTLQTETMQTTYQSNRIALATGKGTCFFTTDDIVRLEASSNYTNIFFTNNTRLLSAKVLKDFAALLEPFGFIRTHRSHLVNRQHILFVDINGNVVMQDHSKAEISRRKKCDVMKELKNVAEEISIVSVMNKTVAC
jgi:two-component system, LytTR family, response regulator